MRIVYFCLFFSSLLLISSCGIDQPDTWRLHVNNVLGSDSAGDGKLSSPYKTITAAMGKSSQKDIIILLHDTGTPYSSTTGEILPIEVENDVIIAAHNGTPVIEDDFNGSLITTANNSGILIQDIIIRNTNSLTTSTALDIGNGTIALSNITIEASIGIQVNSNADLSLADCTVSNCITTGISLNGGFITDNRSTFSNNSIAIDGNAAGQTPTVSLNNTQFTGNDSILVFPADAPVGGCDITFNGITATGSSSANPIISITGDNQIDLIILDSVFTNNIGVSVSPADVIEKTTADASGTVTIINTILTDNGNVSSYWNTLLNTNAPEVYLFNVLAADNNTDSDCLISVIDADIIHIVNCSFIDGDSPNETAITLTAPGGNAPTACILQNTAFSGLANGIECDSTANDYFTVDGDIDLLNCLFGNIAGNPLIDATGAGTNYTVTDLNGHTASSANVSAVPDWDVVYLPNASGNLEDAGTDTSAFIADGFPALDPAGNNRINGTIDIGAYERQ